MQESWCKAHEIKGKSGVILELHLIPGAKLSEIRGIHGNRLKVAIQAPPVDGAANAAFLDFLAGLINIPKARIHLIRGELSKQKTIFIEGREESEIRKLAL
jgi:uncharacterized protein (TIGR00251 family)